jgi:hypothetical protein
MLTIGTIYHSEASIDNFRGEKFDASLFQVEDLVDKNVIIKPLSGSMFMTSLKETEELREEGLIREATEDEAALFMLKTG